MKFLDTSYVDENAKMPVNRFKISNRPALHSLKLIFLALEKKRPELKFCEKY